MKTFKELNAKLTETKETLESLAACVDPTGQPAVDLYGGVSKADMDTFANTVYQNLNLLHKMLGSMSDKHQEDKYKMHDKMYSMMADHMKNSFHLPAITSAEQIGRVVDNLGLSKEFSVKPRTIYASNGEVEKLILEWEPKKKE